MTTRTFCTILSTNYLPRALALGESLRLHEDGAKLKIVFIDHLDDEGLPKLDGVECLSLAALGLPRRTLLEMAMTYDLVEFATSIKPVLFRRLLDDADQVFYLDPDTFVLSPMVELSPALEQTAGGILLTPHFLQPPPRGAELTDGHMLLCGVNNLGFCGFDRRAFDCLDWWWGHLRTECIYDPLAGLFVDQKWMDIGATLFEAGYLRHAGYNVGLGNLVERPITQDADGYAIASTGERLRLFHFHAFDANSPQKLSVRFRHTFDNELEDDVMLQLCKEYAELLIGYEQSLPAVEPYPFWTDTRGRRISLQLRRAYLRESQSAAEPLPSPFEPADAAAYERWRRQAGRPLGRGLLQPSAH
ncbi:MAG TPA: hypothetical protein VIY26_03820, partial [Acidimicrobiales bacterium]